MYCYLLTHGPEGLRRVAENAVLNANYLLARVKHILPAPQGDRCMHEFVASAARLKAERGVAAMDIAKRLLDYGFHAPTVYFPLIVKEAVMIEPTETESKATLDAFAEALFRITRGAPRDAARRPAHHADQPSGRGAGGAAAGAEVEGEVMRKLTPCRLLIDPPGDGAWNMAVDETLLEWAARENACCWRFYQWREPTLSLGYFQEYGRSRRSSGQPRLSRRAAVDRRRGHPARRRTDLQRRAARRPSLGRPGASRSTRRPMKASSRRWPASASSRRSADRPPVGRAGSRCSVSNGGQPATCWWGRPKSPAAPASPPGRRAPARKRAVASFAGRPGTRPPWRTLPQRRSTPTPWPRRGSNGWPNGLPWPGRRADDRRGRIVAPASWPNAATHAPNGRNGGGDRRGAPRRSRR